MVAGCGGGAEKHKTGATGTAAAHRLLVQTFQGHHPITSGVIRVELKVVPHGSRTIKGPMTLSFGGPFTNQGADRLPESDFAIAVSAEGHTGALHVISAGGKGYITVGGQSYRMPGSSFKSLESGFGSLASSGTGSSSQGALSSLGMRPLNWLIDPRIAGTGSVDGVTTTVVRAALDTRAMLHDFSDMLSRAGSLRISGAGSLPHSISEATQRTIAHALGSPSFTVWTGTGDKLIRRLAVSASVPVSGATRTELGGMRSAAITLVFEYSQVNEPQTISAPTVTKPYSVFRAQVSTVLQEIEGALLTGSMGSGSGTGTGSSGGLPADQKYTECITAAHGDVAKMQKCSKLLATG